MLGIGVDVGGTKTQIRIVDENGIIADKIIATQNWRVNNNIDADAKNLYALVQTCVKTTDIISTIVVGCQGCNTDIECKQYAVSMGHVFLGDIIFLNDAELLLAAAGYTEGISVIAGTGSIAVSRDPQKKLMTAGGWGWYLGDEGGAVGLVREAAKLIRQYQDMQIFTDPLMAVFCEAYGTSIDKNDIGYRISELGTADKIGHHVRIIFDAAEQGSIIAKQVIDDAVNILVEQVCLLVKRGAAGNHIVTGGGVMTNAPIFANAFAKKIAEKLPNWTIEPFSDAPVKGAANLVQNIMRGESLGRIPNPYRAV